MIYHIIFIIYTIYRVEDREEECAAGINRQRHQPSDGTWATRWGQPRGRGC